MSLSGHFEVLGAVAQVYFSKQKGGATFSHFLHPLAFLQVARL